LIYLLFLCLNISSILSSVQILQVHENVNVTLTCQLNLTQSNVRRTRTNHSENIILWYKDDTQVIGVNSISNNPRKYFLRNFQLTIINVQFESAGVYKCQNFRAKEENHFQLHVLGK
jgi:hypothetical protein